MALAVVLPLERFVVGADQYVAPVGLAFMVVAECMLFVIVYLSALRLVAPGQYRSVRGFAEKGVGRLRGLFGRTA